MKMRNAVIYLLAITLAGSVLAQQGKTPAGYTYGTSAVPKSPISLEELKLLQQSLLFGEEDVKYLKMSHDILKDQTNDILDVWYDFVG